MDGKRYNIQTNNDNNYDLDILCIVLSEIGPRLLKPVGIRKTDKMS